MSQDESKPEDPIQPKHIENMNKIGSIIDQAFNAGQDPKPYGFALLVFDMGTGGTMNYISNAQRPDMIRAMQEFIKRQIGRN